MSLVPDTCKILDTQWRTLQEVWSNVNRQWQDTVADRFKHEFWNEWENAVPRLLQSAIELDDILDQALRQTDKER